MTDTAVLERETLEAVNTLRRAFGAPELSALRSGLVSCEYACALHHSIDDIGLGIFTISAGGIVVDRNVAERVQRAWNSQFIACPCGPQRCGRLHLTLPALLEEFITAFDDGLFPWLVDPAARQTVGTRELDLVGVMVIEDVITAAPALVG